MSRNFDGTISDIHLISPIPNKELGQLKKGFAIAFWIWPQCNEIDDPKTIPVVGNDATLKDTFLLDECKETSKANTWHHACTIFSSPTDRRILLHSLDYRLKSINLLFCHMHNQPSRSLG